MTRAPALTPQPLERAQFVATWPWTLAVFATMSTAVIRYGVGLHPEWGRFQDGAAKWPDLGESALAVGTNGALLSNTVIVAINGAFKNHSTFGTLLVSAAITAAALVLPFLLRRRNVTFVALSFIVVAGGPLSPVLLTWVGGYDSIVAVAAVLAALGRRWWVYSFGWLLLSLSHYAVAIGALLIWIAIAACFVGERRKSFVTRTLTSAAAVLIGWLINRSIVDAWGGGTDRLTLFREIHLQDLVNSYASSASWILFSALGVAWLLFALPSVWRLRSTRWVFGIIVSTVVIAPLGVADQTRILALILICPMLFWIDTLSDRMRWADSGVGLRPLLIGAAIVPVPVIWMGVPIHSLADTLRVLSEALQ